MTSEQRSDSSVNPESRTSQPKKGSRVKAAWPVYATGVIFAGFIAGFISLFFLQDSLAALGIPDPGRLTTFGLPFFRGVAWMLIALAVGSYLTSAFFISPAVPDKDNSRLIEASLTVDGHIASHTGTWAAWGVVAVALLEIPLVMSDISGTPFVQVLNPEMMGVALGQIATAKAWLWTAGFAALVGIGGLFAKNWASQPMLFGGSIAMLIPLGMEGHSAAGGDHDYGTNTFLWHLLFMLLWVGGLLGLIAHGRRLGPDMTVAVRRYSNLALACFIAMGISGVINAAVRIEFSDWFTTRYGLIVVAKTVLTIALGVFGIIHRKMTIPQLEPRPALFVRIAVVEVLVMAATVGVAITMGRTPPPPPRDPNLSTMAIELGYDLEVAPTVTNVWTMFRFDIMFGTIALLLAGFYAYALVRLHRRGLSWSADRTTWWMLGCASLFIVMSNGIGIYIPAMYSMHMLGHMILSMVVPLLLVLGAPFTLIMEAFQPGEPGRPGIHDWVESLTKSKVLAFITNPIVNLIQFLIFFYVVYLSFPLYEIAISEHAGHVIMNWMFIISGFIYFWEVIGPDPLPKRAPTYLRLAILFASMPLHLFAGVYLMQLTQILGENFYTGLGLPWDIDLYQDQRVGGGIAWGFGQFPLVLVFGRLFIEWLREDRSEAVRHDSKADIDGDADIEEYNKMLAALANDGNTNRFRER